jgi:hypothetical protein
LKSKKQEYNEWGVFFLKKKKGGGGDQTSQICFMEQPQKKFSTEE